MQENLEQPKTKATADLIKCDERYKMIIPVTVEQKIRYACAAVPDKEWSGVLFYTYRGKFSTNNLVITCRDILVMDVGSAAYTEWQNNADVINYMAENDLLDCQMGIIHSHNNMAAFFSGTDTGTLLSEGLDRNNLVSLIVNNDGNYVAAITRTVISAQEVKESCTYQFFGEGEESFEDEYTAEDMYVEYFMLDIVKKEAKGLSKLIERIASLKKPATAYPSYPGYNGYGGYNSYGRTGYNGYGGFMPAKGADHDIDKKPYQAELPFKAPDPVKLPGTGLTTKENHVAPYAPPAKDPVKEPIDNADINKFHGVDDDDDTPVLDDKTKEIVATEKMVMQLITGNIFAEPTEGKTVNGFAATEMEELFRKRFGYATGQKSSFMMYFDSMIDFLVGSCKDFSYSNDDDLYAAEHAIADRLDAIPDKNLYIRAMIIRLKDYVYN